MLTTTASIAVVDEKSSSGDRSRVIVGRDQAEIQRKVTQSVVRGVPVSFCIRERGHTNSLIAPTHNIVDRQRMCILSQWDKPYTHIARGWKRRVNSVGAMRDLCADRCVRDEALAAISGAGLVVYFGHASDVGLDGYHGIALKDMRLHQPIGVLVSWSCNAIFGRRAFGIRLVQKGLVRAFIGTIDRAAKTRDNKALSLMAAESLVTDRPATVGNWMVAIDKAVAERKDRSLKSAWLKFRVVGNIDEPLPSTLAPSL